MLMTKLVALNEGLEKIEIKVTLFSGETQYIKYVRKENGNLENFLKEQRLLNSVILAVSSKDDWLQLKVIT